MFESENTYLNKGLTTNSVSEVVKALKQGAVFAYPTESVWGLGCDPFNEQAVKQILVLKNRPIDKGVILVAGSVHQIQPYIQHLPKRIQQKMIESWQMNNNPNNETSKQAITWLVPLVCAENSTKMSVNIPPWISGEHKSVAIRVTPHLAVQQICNAIGSPIVSTSCNPAGQEPAIDLATAQKYFKTNINYFDYPTLGYVLPSKIVDAQTLQVIRE